MSKLVWDKTGERVYETGVSKGVYYPLEGAAYGTGSAWNGLTSVSESPSGAESSAVYADNIKYLNLVSAEDFGASIGAYTAPDEFAQSDGSKEIAKGVVIGQQARKAFGLCYRTELGNDTQGTDYGYKIHIIYNAQASPSEKGYQTINDSPEAIEMSWTLTTTPINVTGFKPTAHLEIDSTKCVAAKLKLLEDKLYGTESTEPTLPLPDEIIEIVGAAG